MLSYPVQYPDHENSIPDIEAEHRFGFGQPVDLSESHAPKKYHSIEWYQVVSVSTLHQTQTDGPATIARRSINQHPKHHFAELITPGLASPNMLQHYP